MQWPSLAIVFTQILLPLYFLWAPWSRASADRLSWWLTVFYGAAYLIFIHVCGQWSWVGMALRNIIPLLYLLSVALSWRRHRHKPWRLPAPRLRYAGHLASVGFGMFFLVLAGLALSGKRLAAEAVDVAFPLQSGRFAVAHGGDHVLLNYHNPHPAQRYALDLVALNDHGIRARGLMPKQLADYAIQDAIVTSPCNGQVLAIQDGLRNNPPPATDLAHAAGNYVIVGCHGIQILLAHLSPGSIQLAQGQRVTTGTPLARVGNSGNSTEPHLHIHAVRMTGTGTSAEAVGVPLTFGGRFPIRNDVIVR